MRQILAETFFSDDEKRLIAQRVASVEARTLGEVVPVVVDRSDDYPESRLMAAGGLSLLLSLATLLLIDHDTIWYFIPLLILWYLPARLLVRRFPRLITPFISPARRQQAVRDRALSLFYELGLHRTRLESGIMIFISLLERKAWILADRGVDRRIDPAAWEGIVSRLTGGLARGEKGEALCRAIDECGAILATYFPSDGANPNELPDDLMTITRTENRA